MMAAAACRERLKKAAWLGSRHGLFVPAGRVGAGTQGTPAHTWKYIYTYVMGPAAPADGNGPRAATGNRARARFFVNLRLQLGRAKL